MDPTENEMLPMVNEEEGDEDLKIGMKVYSEDEAYKLYNAYAIKKGFSMRKGNIRRDSKGNLRQQEYLCSKQGFRLDDDLEEDKKLHRLETRTGCEALVRFTVDDGVWTISHVNFTHNHEFAKPEERQFLRSGRKITQAHANVISSMVWAGIRPTHSYSFMAKEVGGAEHVGYTRKDCHNFVQRTKGEMIQGGDGQSLLDYFKDKQAQDPNFFYSSQVDQFNRMTNFFWRDGKSRLDYDCFGDVVTFDTTFRTNKYNLICAPFVGVNHHWKNVLFGCAFLLDETTESFVWAFQTFLASMGYRKPKTIFTDEDKAMGNAIEIVLPESLHRLCTWHIFKKAPQHLAGYYAKPGFHEQFTKCFYGCGSEMEFETSWNSMVRDFKLESHKWIKKLYSLREKWCLAFSLDTFSAGIRSTQMSESTNNVFRKISKRTMSLTEFAHHYEETLDDMRVVELEEDFRCKNGSPHLTVHSGMLSHAAEIYTVTLYARFKREHGGCMGVRMREISDDGEVSIYEAIQDGNQKMYTIHFNSLTCTISCSCKLFESLGMLCRHSLKVLDMKNFTNIPDQYILKRWTKAAKKGIAVSSIIDSSHNPERSAQSLRLSELMHEGSTVFSIGSISESGTMIFKRKLAEAMELLEKEMENVSMVDPVDQVCKESILEESDNEPPVLDPPHVRTKGTSKGRFKGNLEKRKKKPSTVARNANKKASKAASTSKTLQPNPMNFGQDNQSTMEGILHCPYPTIMQPSFHQFGAISNPTIRPSFHQFGGISTQTIQPPFHQFGAISNPTFYNQNCSSWLPSGNSNFSFMSMLHDNHQMPYLNEDFCFPELNQSQLQQEKPQQEQEQS